MGALINRYLDWIEKELLSKPSQDTLRKPYWSYDEILHVALQHHNGSDFDEKSYTFEVDLTNRVNSFVRNNNYFIVTNIRKRFVTDFIESPGLPFICMLFPLTVQLVFYWILRLGIHFKVLNPPNNTQIFFSAYWVGWMGIGIFCAILMIAIPAVLAYIFLSINKNKSPRCRYLHNIATANITGFNDQLYESDTIIDFLNSNFRFNLPKDPFRVWREPFFKRNGEFWIIGFNGKRICLGLRKNEFYEQLAFLLSRPRESFSCLDLEKAPAETHTNEYKAQIKPQSNDSNKSKQHANEQFNYNELIEYANDLEYEKTEALSSGNTGEWEKLDDQISKVKAFIKENYTKTGEPKDADPGLEKIRNTIKKRLERIFDDIEPYHPELAGHLRQYVTRGYNPGYNPPPDSEPWDIKY